MKKGKKKKQKICYWQLLTRLARIDLREKEIQRRNKNLKNIEKYVKQMDNL